MILINGKKLTAGEIDLIMAIRNYPISKIYEYKKTALVSFDKNEEPEFTSYHIAFWSDDTCCSQDEAVINALKKIKAEQEAVNNEKY